MACGSDGVAASERLGESLRHYTSLVGFLAEVEQSHRFAGLVAQLIDVLKCTSAPDSYRQSSTSFIRRPGTGWQSHFFSPVWRGAGAHTRWAPSL
jgi:hypothetical protein